MGEVKRYRPIDLMDAGQAYGKVVLATDYATLEAERAEQWSLRRDAEAKVDTQAAIIAELQDENAKLRAELERRAVPDGFRVMLPTSTILNEGDRWEIYAPCGSGGIVNENDVNDWVVRKLLDALAAAPSAPKADERPLYTCIGKGGEYRYLGTAIGAGDSRGELAEVYQDRTGQLFHRTPEDFMERMEPIAAARQEGGK